MSKFIPPLSGLSGKMSSSHNIKSTVFLTDGNVAISNKIKCALFGAGGDGSLSDHKMYGGNPDKDISFQYLKYFEYDDNLLNEMENNFKNGSITCKYIKEKLIEKLIVIIDDHKQNKKNITPELIKKFYENKTF